MSLSENEFISLLHLTVCLRRLWSQAGVSFNSIAAESDDFFKNHPSPILLVAHNGCDIKVISLAFIS